MRYEPPSAEALDRLKNELGKTSSEMAKLFGLSTGRAWRRYSSDVEGNHRDMGMHMLFFAMARLELGEESVERVLERMRKVGASVDLSADGGEQE
ncbi:XRE family transcriptional regulator [Paraburkholderia sp. BR10872]|uniref:XRE family transcriptional regulator n=1 Tax=Paraburkholderia sp. BR10872 TaxID=3236989 RepID=UPI0034D205A0